MRRVLLQRIPAIQTGLSVFERSRQAGCARLRLELGKKFLKRANVLLHKMQEKTKKVKMSRKNSAPSLIGSRKSGAKKRQFCAALINYFLI